MIKNRFTNFNSIFTILRSKTVSNSMVLCFFPPRSENEAHHILAIVFRALEEAMSIDRVNIGPSFNVSSFDFSFGLFCDLIPLLELKLALSVVVVDFVFLSLQL
jgi:hypothetical protein